MRPLRLYLDSSDYSTLSNPKQSSATNTEILNQLKDWKRRGLVSFHYSGTHLSEMAPLDAAFSDAAERRAELLFELCEQNAMVSQNDLFERELRFAHGLLNTQPEMHSSAGEWYPQGVIALSPFSQLELVRDIRESIQATGLNRQGRRAAEKKLLRKGGAGRRLREGTVNTVRSSDLNQIIADYPMRPEDARTLTRFVVGDVSTAEANDALKASLRDPRWMMRWFRNHHDQLTPFLDWVRKPAQIMFVQLEAIAEQAALLRQTDSEVGKPGVEEYLSSKKWNGWQADLLVHLASRFSESLLGEKYPELSADIVDECCPGLSTGIRSLHSAWWTATTQNPRPPKPSDFPDGLHAMYAPYVDVFRADSFMAPYVFNHAKRFGTDVIPKLSGLVPALDKLLMARCLSE